MKGSLLEGALRDLRRLLERGALDRDELEARLPAADLALLEQKILAGAWYPMASLARVLELVWEEESGRRPEALRERGRKAATRLVESGLYRQVDAARRRRGAEFGRMLTSLAGAMYDFGRWEYEGDDEGRTSRVIVSDVAPWPDVLRLATEGFIETLVAAAGGQAARVTSERPTPERVVFQIRIVG